MRSLPGPSFLCCFSRMLGLMPAVGQHNSPPSTSDIAGSDTILRWAVLNVWLYWPAAGACVELDVSTLPLGLL